MQLHANDVRDDGSDVATLRIALLGGFRVERDGMPVPDVAWQRRSAKRLTKVLAILPSHTLHREQVLDMFWPDADLDSSRNSLAKALHAARRALEPERAARDGFCYLRARDDMISLGSDHVVVDVDEFQRLARVALRLGTRADFERALAMYTGALLPEDLYEDWPSERRQHFADLQVRLLLGLAEALVSDGDLAEALDVLHRALDEDPIQEEVHRRVMCLYAAMGARSLALRQFETCRASLRRELDVAPDRETTALYEHLFASDGAPERDQTWASLVPEGLRSSSFAARV
jgi:DNA-binding SARP family transcriptional activator